MSFVNTSKKPMATRLGLCIGGERHMHVLPIGTNVLRVVLSAILVCAGFASSSAADLESVRSFDIKPQNLEAALIEFSKQADLQVIGSSEILADVRTKGVSGKLSSRKALSLLLEDTAVAFNPIG